MKFKLNKFSLDHKKLDQKFYLQPTLKVARELLGKIIVRKFNGKILAGRIVETEAYIGENDPACHAYGGMTTRNKIMYLPGGHAYVYFTYGMHYCFNVVTEREGFPAAVLIRAVEPVEGIELMKKFRKMDDIYNLTNGPAKFCQAFKIDKSLNGVSLLGDEIFIVNPGVETQFKIGRSQRVGISMGTDKKWRFFIRGNPFVSKVKIKPRIKNAK
ncbi:MAG: DNA-3-methyladenine glycosylase [Candidatus Kryptonium sp.]